MGTQEPDYYLLIGRRSSATFPVVTDYNQLPNDNDWSDGIITLNIAHDGNPTNVSLTGLIEDESYFFELYPYTNMGTDTDYKTDNVPTTAATITNNTVSQASGLNFTTANNSSITLNWINGTGTSRIVIVSEGDSVEGEPEDFSSYLADPNFGDGDAIDVNDYVVYNGTGNTVTVTGLSPETQYSFKVFEYYTPFGLNLYVKNSNATNPASKFTLANEPTQQPENLTFSNNTPTSTLLNYTAPSNVPDGYIITRKIFGNVLPKDGVEYAIRDINEDIFVIYQGADLSYKDTFLIPGSNLTYEIFSYNGSGESINYLQTNPLTGSNTVPASEPTTQASNILFTSLGSSSFKINWNNGDGSFKLVLMKANSPVDAIPIDQTTYIADTNFGDGDELGSGNFVVYTGTKNNVVVNGLSPEVKYYVQVFEFHGFTGGENYLTNTATRNPYSRETLPVLNNQVTISNNASTGTASDGMLITSDTDTGDYLQDALDEITWGHNGADTTETNSWVQGTISNRWNRTWYIAKSDQFDNNGQLKITFDLPDAGLSQTFNKDFNYFLIYSPDNIQSFTTVSYYGAYKAPSNDKIEFTLNEALLPEGYYTLGRTDASPIAENALYFDGIDDYVDLDDKIDLLGSFTLEAWVQLNDITGTQPIISKGEDDNNQSFLLKVEDGDIVFDWGDNTAKIYGNRKVEVGKWYHIAVVIDNSNTTANIYLNGLKIAENTTASTHSDITSNTHIGKSGTGFFNGKIDELRIWKEAKTQTEIKADNYQHINGNEANLVAYYRFDQFNNNILPDLSKNNFNGVLESSMSAANWVSSLAMIPPSISYNSGKEGGTIKQGKDDEIIYECNFNYFPSRCFFRKY